MAGARFHIVACLSAALLPVIFVCVDYLNEEFATFPQTPGIVPENYVPNDRSEQEVTASVGQYQMDYVFRDKDEQPWHWRWSYRSTVTDKEISHYGVPEEIYEPYVPSKAEERRRKRIIEEALFVREGNFVSPDYSALVAHYMPFTLPIYQLLEKATEGKSRRDRIEMLIKFVQDIPYGIPPDSEDGKVLHGVIPPPFLLTETWGDCDSKAVLFASVMAHDPSINIVFLSVPDHLLLAIEDIPRPYQQSLRHKGKTYVLVEAVGPARFDYGDAGAVKYQRFNRIRDIEPQKYRNSHFDMVAAAAPALGEREDSLREIGAFEQETAIASIGNQDVTPGTAGGPPVIEWSDGGGQVPPAPVGQTGTGPAITWTDSTPTPEPATGAGDGGVVWYDDDPVATAGVTIADVRRAGSYVKLFLDVPKGKAVRAALKMDGEELEDAVLVQYDTDRVEVTALAGEAGRYDLSVYAKDIGTSGDYPFVTSYPFVQEEEAGLSGSLRSFPYTYGKYSEVTAHLASPLYSPLRPGQTVVVKIKVPGAKKVGVSVSGNIQLLTESAGWYQGRLQVGDGSDLLLIAAFDNSGEYFGLARYGISDYQVLERGDRKD